MKPWRTRERPDAARVAWQVAALEGLKMAQVNFSRLQLVQANLLRYWGEKP